MNIELKTNINQKVLRKMAVFQMIVLRKSNFIILSLALIIGVATSIYGIVVEENKTIYLVLLVLLPLMYGFLFLVSPYLSASSVFKKIGVKKDEVVNYQYHFQESEFEVKLFFGEEMKASNTVKYEEIANFYTFGNYVFLVMKERYAFAIELNEENKNDVLTVKEYLQKMINATVTK